MPLFLESRKRLHRYYCGYKGISVADDTVLRKKLRESGNTYTVVKNTILGRALEAAGSKAWKLIWKVHGYCCI